MNWAVVLFTGLVILIIIDWVFRGKRRYVVTGA